MEDYVGEGCREAFIGNRQRQRLKHAKDLKPVSCRSGTYEYGANRYHLEAATRSRVCTALCLDPTLLVGTYQSKGL